MSKAFDVVSNSEKEWRKKHHEPNITAKRLNTSFSILLNRRPFCIIETSPLVFWNPEHTEVISMDMNLQERIMNIVNAFSEF